jgi:hypothetical protein
MSPNYLGSTHVTATPTWITRGDAFNIFPRRCRPKSKGSGNKSTAIHSSITLQLSSAGYSYLQLCSARELRWVGPPQLCAGSTGAWGFSGLGLMKRSSALVTQVEPMHDMHVHTNVHSNLHAMWMCARLISTSHIETCLCQTFLVIRYVDNFTSTSRG